MNRLKELTAENHKRAESCAFAKELMSGISPERYHFYLLNQHAIYSALEDKAKVILDRFPDVRRSDLIMEDIEEIESIHNVERKDLLPVVKAYEDYVSKLDERGLLAHIYVRHFGDMYGGQMIKRRVCGSGKMYEFENVKTLKESIRELLDDSMGDEANACFNFAIRLFEELE